MGRKRKYEPLMMEKIVLEYINGKKGKSQIENDYQISDFSLYRWVNLYKKHGIEFFMDSSQNKSYSKQFKEKVVEEYLCGKGSVEDLAIKYEIRSKAQIYEWVKKYNIGEQLKDYDPKGEVYMKQNARKTTVEERKEITEYCIANDNDYKSTAEKYSVSYTQVYQWVKKYTLKGDNGLTDKRGRRKSQQEPANETEELQRRIRILEAQLENEKKKNMLLKKVQEFERSGCPGKEK